MELNITELLEDAFYEASNHSASQAEMGQDAGIITWNNSLNSEHNLITSDEIESAVIEHFKGYGAWDDLDEWPRNELNALLIQDISAAIRETDFNDDNEGSLLFVGDNGDTYFYLGA